MGSYETGTRPCLIVAAELQERFLLLGYVLHVVLRHPEPPTSEGRFGAAVGVVW